MMKKLFIIITILACISCNKDEGPFAPTMITDIAVSVRENTATLGGEVLEDGGAEITEYGIVYSQNNPPTVNDTKIAAGFQNSSFSNTYSGFEANTRYYYSAYGMNEAGTSYGDVFFFRTNQEAYCSPEVDNFIDCDSFSTVFDSVVKFLPEPTVLNDGFIYFEATSSSNDVRIVLQFKENGAMAPLTGEYTTGTMNTLSPYSDGIVTLIVYDPTNLNQGITRDRRPLFVENNGTEITFIFCDVGIRNDYILNGKFSYTE